MPEQITNGSFGPKENTRRLAAGMGGKRTFALDRDIAVSPQEEVAMRWFKPAGVLFLPASAAGWLITAAALAFCVQVFWFVDARSHSATDTLYGILPFWVPILLALAWIADRTGGRA